MLPDHIPQYIDHSLRLRGVDVTLRVFPWQHQFVFNTSPPTTEAQRQWICRYIRDEGFLDNPITGEEAHSLS